MDRIDLDQPRDPNELRALEKELADAITQLNTEYAGRALPDDVREDFAYYEETIKSVRALILEIEARDKLVAEVSNIGAREENREQPFPKSVQTSRPGAVRGGDIYDLSTVRAAWDNPTEAAKELKDRALRSIEMERFPETPDGYRRDSHEDKQGRVRDLMERMDRGENPGRVAQLVLATGSPAYRRAFSKYITGRQMTREEQAAAERAFTIGSTGNYPVPYVWDPTVTLTSNGVLNPVRQIADVKQITGNTWYGVNSAGITASYSNEATEASDNTPTLTQPTANVEKAQAFVPFSIETAEDWDGLEAEMAREFADAKDTLESDKFLTGLGHGSNEPEGLLIGATGTIFSAATAVFAVADLYSLRQALAPRWRARGSFVGNIAALDKIRQFDQYGGSALWVQLQFDNPPLVLGRPIYEWSNMSSSVTTTGASILTHGDFSQFQIIDRVGMSVELVPHLFGGSNRFPTGQRGLYAYWRNTSDVKVSAAFKTLKLL